MTRTPQPTPSQLAALVLAAHGPLYAQGGAWGHLDAVRRWRESKEAFSVDGDAPTTHTIRACIARGWFAEEKTLGRSVAITPWGRETLEATRVAWCVQGWRGLWEPAGAKDTPARLGYLARQEARRTPLLAAQMMTAEEAFDRAFPSLHPSERKNLSEGGKNPLPSP